MTDNPYQPPQSSVEAGGPTAAAAVFSFVAPGKAVIYALAAGIIVSVLSIIVMLSQDALLSEALASGEIAPEAAVANDQRVAMIGVLELSVYILCVVLWGMWTVRAAKNVRALEPDATFEFTPGWAFGWFFIPFLNLVRPYQAMKEIWFHSQSNVSNVPGGTASLVGGWWAIWIISNLVAQVAFRLAPDEGASLASLQTAGYVEMAASITSIFAAVVAIHMVRTINGHQACKHEGQRGGQPAVPVWAAPRSS